MSRLAAARAVLMGTDVPAGAEAIHLYNLGVRLMDDGQHAAASALIHRAAKLAPGDHVIRENSARLHASEFNFVEAFAQLSGLPEDNIQIPLVHGLYAWSLGRLEEAVTHFARLADNPKAAKDDRVSYAAALFLVGRWEEGWKAYEEQFATSDNPAPRWDGSQVNRLLVHWEQGQGDVIMFARYVRMAASRARKLYIQMPAQMSQLLAGYAQYGDLVQKIDDLTVDAQIGMHALPALYGASPCNIASLINVIRYLPVDLPKAKRGRTRIGLCWAGNMRYARDRWRSMSFETMLPLASIARAEFFSLQDGKRASDIALAGAQGLVTDLAGQIGQDWAYCAGAIHQMDAVITVDTAVAHLAGSMGKRVFLCLPRLPDWRWGFEFDTTPWYPSMTLVRQDNPGDWAGVIGRVGSMLERL